MDERSDKRSLRALLRRRIAELGIDYVNQSDDGIFNRLTALPELLAAGRLFSYFSVRREPDTHRLTFWALSRGMPVALPVPLPGGRMEFRLFTGATERGPLGIPVPAKGEAVFPAAGDIIVVPALAFDAQGYRLGQGGGYYDRLLSAAAAFTVGLCREALLLERAPRESHDIPVRCVVTEKRTARP